LKISSYNGKNSNTLGYYRHGKEIALGVENLSVWIHELVHAACDRLGNLKKGVGQEQSNEIVAEMGSVVLLTILGYKSDIDIGGAWNYIKHYAGGNDEKTIKICTDLINRVCSSVNLIIEESNVIIGENNL